MRKCRFLINLLKLEIKKKNDEINQQTLIWMDYHMHNQNCWQRKMSCKLTCSKTTLLECVYIWYDTSLMLKTENSSIQTGFLHPLIGANMLQMVIIKMKYKKLLIHLNFFLQFLIKNIGILLLPNILLIFFQLIIQLFILLPNLTLLSWVTEARWIAVMIDREMMDSRNRKCYVNE